MLMRAISATRVQGRPRAAHDPIFLPLASVFGTSTPFCRASFAAFFLATIALRSRSYSIRSSKLARTYGGAMRGLERADSHASVQVSSVRIGRAPRPCAMRARSRPCRGSYSSHQRGTKRSRRIELTSSPCEPPDAPSPRAPALPRRTVRLWSMDGSTCRHTTPVQ